MEQPPAGPRRCQAKSKQSGRQCRRPAAVGMTVCYMHGGKTPTGIAAPSFRHGLYSKVLPKDLRKNYARALRGPNLLALDAEVALLPVRAAELVKGLAQSQAPPWGQAVDFLNKSSRIVNRSRLVVTPYCNSFPGGAI